MWLPSWKTDDFCCGLEYMTNLQRVGQCPACRVSSPQNKHSHRQHSSVTVLRHATASRERQGQSLAQAWRDAPREISGIGVLSHSLEPRHSTENVWEVLTLCHRAAARSTGRAVMLLGFIFPSFFLSAPLWNACSCAMWEAGSSCVTIVVCLFYQERHNKDVLPWDFCFSVF